MQARMLAVLEAATVVAEPESAWGTRVAGALARGVDGGLQATVLAYDRARGTIRDLAEPDPRVSSVMAAGQTCLDRPRLQQVYGEGATAHTATEVLGDRPPAPLEAALARSGAADVLGIAGPADRRGRGVSFGVLLDRARDLGPSERAWLRALGTQLGAFHRVRAALRRVAEGDVGADPLAARLAGAFSELDRRRAALVRDPAEGRAAEVVALQQRLLDEGYVVVPVEVGDGRTRLVAVRAHDEPDPQLRALSPEERAVVRRAVVGLSDKEIAWELDVPLGTVASRLRRARQRLGLARRAELVRLLAGLS